MADTVVHTDESPVRPPTSAPSGLRSTLGSAFGAVPPPVLLVLSITCTQTGAAIAKSLFATLGATGTVSLRVGFAALVLVLVWRPRIRGYSRRAYLDSLFFGLALAMMNLCFYSALARIPLGAAVTLEFVGPLSVAVIGSRRLIDLIWVALAAFGIVSLAPFTGAHLNIEGFVLALLAGGCWALYIVFSARVGRAIPGVGGLALAMVVASIVLVPAGIAKAGTALFGPRALLEGFGIALLSSAVPYSLEIEALRRLPTRVFGLLMSMEPAMAALVGFVFLGEGVTMRSLIAILSITAATVGTIVGNRQSPLV